MPSGKSIPAETPASKTHPTTLYEALQLTVPTASTRANEAQQLYTYVADILENHTQSDGVKALPSHMKVAYKAFCDDFSSVAKRHFEYICGSDCPPEPYTVAGNTPVATLPTQTPISTRETSRSPSAPYAVDAPTTSAIQPANEPIQLTTTRASKEQYLDSKVADRSQEYLQEVKKSLPAHLHCNACNWTPERQESCNYHSHVKLFYGVSDRGVWALGSQRILKERSSNPPNFEADNIRFIKEKTSIPVPIITDEWEDDNNRYFLTTKRIHGISLNIAWPTLSTASKERIAKQTAEHISQLRKLHAPAMQSLNGQPIYSAFLFPNGYGLPHGPLSSDDELWTEMAKSLKNVPEKACQHLRERMPSASPFTFTHGDLTNVNIIVKEGNLAGILDWEASGYFPAWWEFTCAGIGLGKEDFEWKTLLRKYMPDFTAAHKFWLDFDALRRYPKLDQRGEQLVKELLKN